MITHTTSTSLAHTTRQITISMRSRRKFVSMSDGDLHPTSHKSPRDNIRSVSIPSHEEWQNSLEKNHTGGTHGDTRQRR